MTRAKSSVDAAAGSNPAGDVRDAACVVVIDRSAEQPRMLMGRRRDTQIFMPNKWVFPGGRVDDIDRTLAPVLAARAAALAGPAPAMDARLQPFALAAVRELLEEAGLAIGQAAPEPAATADALPGPWQAFAVCGVAPAPFALTPLARAITPPGLVRRYDTWFFTVEADAIGARPHGGDGELLDLGWFTLAEAGQLNVAGITRMVLADLTHHLQNGANAAQTVPFYQHDGSLYRRTLLAL